ncbi:hypothetical protein JM654_06275 [Microbacterium oxydans]|nr:hypothetical protein [Microbacterium oxydans]
MTLSLGGAGIVSTPLVITVLTADDPDTSTTEQLLWFDGFETDSWTREGAWTLSNLDSVIAQYGTDRRHAFTRASGRIAVAEATSGAFAGSLASSPIAVKAGGCAGGAPRQPLPQEGRNPAWHRDGGVRRGNGDRAARALRCRRGVSAAPAAGHGAGGRIRDDPAVRLRRPRRRGIVDARRRAGGAPARGTRRRSRGQHRGRHLQRRAGGRRRDD